MSNVDGTDLSHNISCPGMNEPTKSTYRRVSTGCPSSVLAGIPVARMQPPTVRSFLSLRWLGANLVDRLRSASSGSSSSRFTTRRPTKAVAPVMAMVRTEDCIAPTLESPGRSPSPTLLARASALVIPSHTMRASSTRSSTRDRGSKVGLALRMAEAGVFPDLLLRSGTRYLLRRRLQESVSGSPDARRREQSELMESLANGPIAIAVNAANEQHYEVPAHFFELALGPRLKYSCCHWESTTHDLAAAEEAMLELTALRARIQDGMRILDLGCGWGSFSLWAAERFPNTQILAVSNSCLQRKFIEARAAAAGLTNVRVQTADINDFQPDERFDRLVSIEMMEHVRNHRVLFERIARWLTPGGMAFAHIFCHRSHAYTYEHRDPSDWMAKNFFTGGMMPSEGMFRRYQDDLALREQWRVDGTHYNRTCDAWLERLDQNRDTALQILSDGYGAGASRWFHRWRLFFIACSELFAYRGGNEWFVSHYLWEKRGVNHLSNKMLDKT